MKIQLMKNLMILIFGILNINVLLYKFGQTLNDLTLKKVGMTYNLERKEYIQWQG